MKKLTIALTAMTAAFAWSCQSDDKPADTTTPPQDTIVVNDTLPMRAKPEVEKPANMDTIVWEKTQYRDKVMFRLDSMERRMNEVDEQIRNAGPEASDKLMQAREKIRQRMHRTRQQLNAQGQEMEQDWDKFKANVDSSVDSLRSDWNQFLEKLKVKKK